MIKKISWKIQIAVISLFILATVGAVVGFKSIFETKIEKDVVAKASEIAVMSQNTLNMFMETGMISDENHRKLFFEKTGASEDIKEFRVFRSAATANIFGLGMKIEQPTTKMDKDMIKTGNIQVSKSVKEGKTLLTMSYPYKASKNFRGTDCTSCHMVKENTVLGGATITLDITKDVEEMNHTLKNMIYIAVGVILVIILLLSMGINRLINKPLQRFQCGLLGFFDYLNHKTENIEKISMKTGDEFETMANVINENIEITQENIEKDKKVIDNTNKVLIEVNKGNFNEQIIADTNTEALKDLVGSINKMIKETNHHFVEINNALDAFTNYDYTKPLELSNIDKDSSFEVLQNNVNDLRTAIVDMLKLNSTNGNTLSNFSKELLTNVESLNKSTTSAAGQLEETSSSLEDLTNIASANAEKVNEMAQLSTTVTNLAKSGNEMANNTKSAMDEINNQVTAIETAIQMIDQIAFQTNILSLNAAVEAATAGEHGKGFAVVAQEVRNLAAKSADAANEIKSLVQTATDKTEEGKVTSDEMIEGYSDLIENINKTIDLIKAVEEATGEQQNSIIQINESVRFLDEQTQRNAHISADTQEIAQETSEIANNIVEDTNNKKY